MSCFIASAVISVDECCAPLKTAGFFSAPVAALRAMAVTSQNASSASFLDFVGKR